MDDVIRRQAVIDAIETTTWYHQNKNLEMVSGANSKEHQAWYKAEDVFDAIANVPSTEDPSSVAQDISQIIVNEMDMRRWLISSLKPEQKKESEHDPVKHPAHYTSGKIEVWDFIADQDLDYFLGNAVKYICRCGRKTDADKSRQEKALEDLEKAIAYLRKKIEVMQNAD